MSRFGKIARRTFLIGSAAIVGGVAFGVWTVRRPAPNPLNPAEGEAALNPFVLIDGQGVTLFAPRAEMGQGVSTTWAALIAEEMDVDLDQVRVLHGPAAEAYYNTALAGEGLPGKGYDTSDFKHNLGEMLGPVGKVLGLQVTGGSTSMKDGIDRMRAAGASARETLKEAAARRLGLDRDDLETERGMVRARGGVEIAYTDLAAEAAELEPVEADLRPAESWRLLGKDQPRVDMVPKVTGTAEFGLDVRLPGMKFAALKRNPMLSGGIGTLEDEQAALDIPGVEKVVALSDGYAVVASNSWSAMQGAEALSVAWPIPDAAPATTEDAMKRIAGAFHDNPNSTLRDDGDVEALPGGAVLVEAEYTVPYLAHTTMEPMNATAWLDGERMHIWAGMQAPLFARNAAADIAGLDRDQVEVHTTFLGGGFGRRGEADFTTHAAELAAKLPGTPVQLMWSREEDMTHDFYRPAAIARFRGAVQDGKPVMLDGAIATQSPLFQSLERRLGFAGGGSDKVLVEGAYNQPYAIPNYRIAGHIAEMPVPVGFWRSVGNSMNGFFHESFIDEMAHAAGRDPLDFRLEMARAEWEPAAQVLEAVREMSGWTGETPEGVGRGVALTYSFGTPVAEVVEVRDEDGSIRIAKMWIAADLGTALDPRNLEAQMTGGAVYGLSAAVMGEITIADHAVEQLNFPDYDALRLHNTPEFEVRILETQTHLGGAGEPGTPPAAPALANALFDLTGRRARHLPLNREFDFLV